MKAYKYMNKVEKAIYAKEIIENGAAAYNTEVKNPYEQSTQLDKWALWELGKCQAAINQYKCNTLDRPDYIDKPIFPEDRVEKGAEVNTFMPNRKQ